MTYMSKFQLYYFCLKDEDKIDVYLYNYVVVIINYSFSNPFLIHINDDQ